MEKMAIEKSSGALSKARLDAFCDGVFAIAITLLILEVKIPKHEDIVQYGGLLSYLVHLWPSYFAYAFSFFVIGVYWANHHYLSQFFTHTNHYFNLLTTLFLMCIAFIPFPTALLGDFISDAENRTTAISFYIFGGLLLPAVSWNLLWRYGTYKKRLTEQCNDPLRRCFQTQLFNLKVVQPQGIAPTCYSSTNVRSYCMPIFLV